MTKCSYCKVELEENEPICSYCNMYNKEQIKYDIANIEVQEQKEQTDKEQSTAVENVYYQQYLF